MKDRKNLLIATSLFCIILIKRLLFLNIGVNWEESKDLVMIFQIANGEVIYRDFYHVYGYLGLYIYTIFFKVFGIFHILFPRLVVSLLFAISAIFAYKTASRFPPHSGLLPLYWSAFHHLEQENILIVIYLVLGERW